MNYLAVPFSYDLQVKLEAGQLDKEEGSTEEAEVVKWFAGRLKKEILRCNRSETSSNCIRVLEK